MTTKTFTDNRARQIIIEIDDNNNIISFFFESHVLGQQEWVREQEQQGIEVSEEQKKSHEFYWIPKDDWKRDKTERLDRGDNWHTHMKEKNWFTDEMLNFLNDNV